LTGQTVKDSDGGRGRCSRQAKIAAFGSSYKVGADLSANRLVHQTYLQRPATSLRGQAIAAFGSSFRFLVSPKIDVDYPSPVGAAEGCEAVPRQTAIAAFGSSYKVGAHLSANRLVHQTYLQRPATSLRGQAIAAFGSSFRFLVSPKIDANYPSPVGAAEGCEAVPQTDRNRSLRQLLQNGSRPVREQAGTSDTSSASGNKPSWASAPIG